MKVYFKSLHKGDDFKELGDLAVDLNNTIFKVVCENTIKEVIIGDEKFNAYEKNEIEFIKLRTSNNEKVELKVIESIEGKRDKVSKEIIKVIDNSFIYDNMELDKIRQLGELAYRNITSELRYSSDDYYETIMKNLNSGLEDIDEIYTALTKVVKLARNIAENPKVELVQSEEVRDSNEVKKISANSARYFIMHPEDWYKEGDSSPKPLRMLTDTFEEIKDIYENQLIKFVIYKCEKLAKSKIALLKANKSTLETALIKYEANNISEYENYIENKKELSVKALQLRNFIAMKKELKRVYDLFNEITLNKRIKFRMTQKILYDKRYLRVMQLFKSKLRNKDEAVEDIFERMYPIKYSYMFIIAESICLAMQSLGFFEYKCNTLYELDIFKEGNIIIESNHFKDEDNFKYILEINEKLDSKDSIKLTLIYKEKREEFIFSINSLFKNKNINEDDIEKIYSIYSQEGSGICRLIVNTVSLEAIEFSSDEAMRRLIFKMSNLGNNFITEKDYENYGGYKTGMIPFGLSDISNVFDKLHNLFYMKFFHIGFYEYCKSCGNGEFDFIDDNLLSCNSCNQRVAINKCDCCGEKNIKILSKDIQVLGEDEIKFKNIFEQHKNYELRSNTLGACYGNYTSNSGGFCSSCGRCQKKVGNCLRCSLVEWEEE